jgi:hypothetical protein
MGRKTIINIIQLKFDNKTIPSRSLYYTNYIITFFTHTCVETMKYFYCRLNGDSMYVAVVAEGRGGKFFQNGDQ